MVTGSFAKALHVSPFMGMDQRYEARMTAPGPTLSVHIENHEASGLHFDATLSLRRRELSPRTVAGMLVRYPLPTAARARPHLRQRGAAGAAPRADPLPPRAGAGMSSATVPPAG